MTAYFYDSTGSNTSPYDTWAKACTSLATVASVMAAGDTLWVGDDSNESVAVLTSVTFSGTSASPILIYCVDHTKASPGTGDLKTGAAGAGSVTTTGNNALTLRGRFYCNGVYFSSGSSTAAVALNIATAAGDMQKYENCVLKTGGSASSGLAMGSSPSTVWLVNCTITFSSTNATIGGNTGRIKIQGGSLTGTAPTTLFGVTAGSIELEGFDYSNLGTNTLFNNPTGVGQSGIVKDCKAPSSYTRVTTQTLPLLGEYVIIRSDSSATAYIQEKYNYWGSQVVETSVIRTPGASDGTTGISWKVTPLHTSWVEPFVCMPIAIWNDTIGTVSVTLHATSNLASGAFPNTDDIWIEVEGPGTSGSPQGIYANNTKANNLATGSAYTTDSASWGGSPAGGTFAMTATIVTTQKGPLTVYVKCAKISTVFYVDPLITLS